MKYALEEMNEKFPLPDGMEWFNLGNRTRGPDWNILDKESGWFYAWVNKGDLIVAHFEWSEHLNALDATKFIERDIPVANEDEAYSLMSARMLLGVFD